MSRRKNYEDILKQYYGHETLKDLQYEIIENCIMGNDTIALLPTSYGKSICYQLPYLITKTNVIVVSPLISLMEDQKQDLISKNIDVVCLNSSNKNRDDDITDIYKGSSKIIYTTPEFLSGNKGFLEKLIFLDRLALIAIDECHCIKSFGHSFRNHYQKLNFLKEYAPDIPILALSATVTDNDIVDLQKNLQLNEPKIVKHTVDRDNLYLEVHPRDEKTIDNTINTLIEKHKNDGRIIVYCKTTSKTDKVAEIIKKAGHKCESYHGKKKAKERTEIQRQFTDNEINIIVATVAFGMGINIPDIRVLIHYNCSNDVETYMQETGRAGRDGKKSYCYMFYSNQDFFLNYSFLDDIQNYVVKKQKESEINYLKKYVTSTECRRKLLLHYYGEQLKTNNCKNCDNCLNQKYERDFTKEAFLLFSQMSTLRNNLGVNTNIKLLLGSKDKNVSKYIPHVQSYYGKGKSYGDDWWKKFIGILTTNGYILDEKIKSTGKMQSICAIVIKLSSKGFTWYMAHKTNDKDKEKMVLSIPSNFKKIDVSKEQKEEAEIEEVKKMFKKQSNPNNKNNKKSSSESDDNKKKKTSKSK
jgi:Mimiviridae putative ATP-dependent RNA helicase